MLMSQLGLFHAEDKQLEQARPLLQQVYDAERERDALSLATAAAAEALASVLRDQRDFDQARMLLEEALSICAVRVHPFSGLTVHRQWRAQEKSVSKMQPSLPTSAPFNECRIVVGEQAKKKGVILAKEMLQLVRLELLVQTEDSYLRAHNHAQRCCEQLERILDEYATTAASHSSSGWFKRRPSPDALRKVILSPTYPGHGLLTTRDGVLMW
jgi:tetratricopeptide (TPR) repeat protein